mgnify:CR=1 FL=1
MNVVDKKLNEVFILGCMFVGLGEITEKNAEEWQWRYAFSAKLNGAYYQVNEKPYIPTLEEVKKRIGLHTNCFPDKTRNQFLQAQARQFSNR